MFKIKQMLISPYYICFVIMWMLSIIFLLGFCWFLDSIYPENTIKQKFIFFLLMWGYGACNQMSQSFYKEYKNAKKETV